MINTDHPLCQAADVTANRTGQLAPGQRERLDTARRGAAILAAVWGGLTGTIAGGVLAISAIRTICGEPDSNNGLHLGAFAFAILLGCAAGATGVHKIRARWWRGCLASARPVASSEGAVAWDGRRYRVRAGWRRLRSAYGELGLEPGRYRFHRLKWTSLIISVEPLDQPSRRFDRYREVVAVASGSSPEDSQLGGPARTRLWKDIGISLLIAGFFTLFGIVVFLDLVPELGRQIGNDAGARAILALVVLGVIGWSLWRAHSLWQDLREGKVATVEGIGQLSADLNDSESPCYYLTVAGVRVVLTKEAYAAIIPDRRYRLRYTPRSRTLVGIEPLE
jgi:hypothetical protein